MMRQILKTTLLTVHLVTGCGQDSKKRAGSAEAPNGEPKRQDQVLSLPEVQSRLRHEILAMALYRKLIDYPTYAHHIDNNDVPIFKGKKKRIIETENLFNEGIKTCGDAFQDLEWINEFNPAKLANAIRAVALRLEFIDEEEFLRLHIKKIVPTYRDWIRVDYHEEDLLSQWIVTVKHAFAGSVMSEDE